MKVISLANPVNSRKLLAGEAEDNLERSLSILLGNVQRLSEASEYTQVSGSAGHPNSHEKDDDIVCTPCESMGCGSCRGYELTTHTEHTRQSGLGYSGPYGRNSICKTPLIQGNP